MNKKEYEEWVIKADEALQYSSLFKDKAHQNILKSYNGQIAALGVSILMSGLLPTLAIYYQHQLEQKNAACRRNVLEVIARMMDYADAKALFEEVLELNKKKRNPNQNEKDLKDFETKWKQLQNKIVDCSVALKQVVRTYNLVD